MHTHTNKLANETSVYLLQHAHNPVEWYTWGEEALQKAKDEDKPILVSIGYAACHWCHVMERESFEDERTAEIMNKYFINIKIDREERPDLDHIYMDAVQAMSGSGGWPLNVFLTPDRKPFYGGTYFPPVRAHNRTSWKELLLNIHQLFSEKRNEVDAQAENLTAHLGESNSFGTYINKQTSDEIFNQQNCALIAENLLKNADPTWGGFGRAPKFPQTFSIQYLLRQYHFDKEQKGLKQALLSLDKMIQGGIYDQLGGGFARYSTDEEWLAPHFEKMLYDNALFINVLAEAYQLTHIPLYKETIEHTLAFIEREMLDSDGGFYSALDADSEGVEGKFYVWEKEEIDELLTEDSELFCQYYDVSHHGNWEDSNILRILKPLDEFAADNGLDITSLQNLLARSREKLMAVRDKRIRPQLDDKILLGWNALMITAYCKGYAATGNDAYKQIALKAIGFIENKFRRGDNSFYHTYKGGEAKIEAFLDDYANLIQAYIHLQEITGNQYFIEQAKALVDFVIDNFGADQEGFFYYTHKQQQDIIVRKKEVYDGATPSGNAVMVGNLIYLSILLDNSAWNAMALNAIKSMATAIIKYPTSFGVWASILQSITNGIKEVVVLGNDFNYDLSVLLKQYIPNKVLQVSTTPLAQYPLLAGKQKEAYNQFFLCENYACQKPEKDLDKFILHFNN